MLVRVITVGVVLAAAPSTIVAQTRPDPRTPRPAHERLAAFEGNWRLLDPAEQTVESCAWIEGGRRHMVCRNRRPTVNGSFEHRTIYSYRGRDSTYIVTALLATGQVWTYLGRPEGDKWVFNLQSDRSNNSQRLRMLVTVGTDTIRFVEESSEGDSPWRVTEDYRHVRVRLQ